MPHSPLYPPGSDPLQREFSKADVKQQLDEYRQFMLTSNMVNTCLAFTLGAAFGKIVTSLVSNLVMPVVNFLMKATGTDWRLLTWAPASGMKLEVGSFIGASLDFLVTSLVCYFLWKLSKRIAHPVDPFKAAEPPKS